MDDKEDLEQVQPKIEHGDKKSSTIFMNKSHRKLHFQQLLLFIHALN